MKVDILGVPVDDVSFDEAVTHIGDLARDGGRHYVVTANPEMVVEAQRNEAFRQVLQQADLVVPDGIGLLPMAQLLSENIQNGFARLVRAKILLLNTLYTRRYFRVLRHRVSGADLVWALCHWAAEHNVAVAFVGGKPGEVDGAAAKVLAHYPSLRLVTDPGAADITNEQAEEFHRLEQKLVGTSGCLIFVAYGHPKQELWISQHLSELPPGVCMGVGGSFAYMSNQKKRAHPALRAIGLEWFWRLLLEPSRIKRIFTATVVFPYLVYRHKSSN